MVARGGNPPRSRSHQVVAPDQDLRRYLPRHQPDSRCRDQRECGKDKNVNCDDDSGAIFC